MKDSVIDLITRTEKWELKDGKVWVYGQEFPVVHPCLIHLKLYRTETNPDIKYLHMKAAHDYLWPKEIATWHYWAEERFREHCADWSFISWAAGAGASKSYDAAKIGLLYWFADPKNRGVVIASTTLDSAEARVWGYLAGFINKRALKVPLEYYAAKPPRVLYPTEKKHGEEAKETICGIFAVAAKQGGDSEAINTWIGRHPPGGLMLILDECPDLNPAISKSFVNLDLGTIPFQCLAIGNSKSWHDLHGAISYPKDGVESVDPQIHKKWETTQKNGICMFFSCYDSPAIHEKDPKKKKLLGTFLITEDVIKEKEKTYGKDSDEFYRMVLGFWRSQSMEGVVVSQNFLDSTEIKNKTEWLGLEPLEVCAGIDPAFSTGGDSFVLRLAILGQASDGRIILDYKGDSLLFKIRISARSEKAAEIQAAEQVMEILDKYKCPIKCVCIDANGQGRAFGGTLQLQMKSLVAPTKIYSVRNGSENVNSFDVVIMEPYEMWMGLRRFIESGQIRGLDNVAMLQLTKRQVVSVDSKGKPCKPRLENKSEFKRRMGAIMPILAHSPDEADAATLCLQSAIIHYGFRIGQRREVTVFKDFAHEKMFAFEAQMKMEQQQQASNVLSIGSGYTLPLTEFRKIPR